VAGSRDLKPRVQHFSPRNLRFSSTGSRINPVEMPSDFHSNATLAELFDKVTELGVIGSIHTGLPRGEL